MNFSKEKNGYNVMEVDAYVKSAEATASDQTERIEELKNEVAELSARLQVEKQRRDLINKAIYNAVAKADQIENLSRRKYEQDMAQLKAFHEKWMAYYNRIIAHYPIDDTLNEVSAFNRRMNDILSGKKAKPLESYMQAEEKRIAKKDAPAKEKEQAKENAKINDFDPIKRIREYLDNESKKQNAFETQNNAEVKPARPVPSKITDVSDTGFSFEEALNPTDDLSTIMRDLGFDVKEDK